MRTKVVVADDHPIVLDGIARLFAQEPDLEVVARCVNGEEALQAVRRLRPDVLVLDLSMPKKSGIQVLRQMRAEKLPTRVVVLTAGLSDEQLHDAMSLAVADVVLKDSAPELLVECVRRVHSGRKWSDPRPMPVVASPAADGREAPVLTPREVELVRLVARGLRNKEIADLLAITEGTVKVHLHNVYEKLEVEGRVALVRRAEQMGLL